MELHIETLPFSALPNADRKLCERALEVASRAYAPYSGFAVGVAVRTASGKVFVGANLENASYGLSICAEVAALTEANTHGADDIETIAVVGYKYAPIFDHQAIVTPCGRCRQLIWEARCRARSDIKVICCNGDLTSAAVFSIAELLPAAFDVVALRQFDDHPPAETHPHSHPLKQRRVS